MKCHFSKALQLLQRALMQASAAGNIPLGKVVSSCSEPACLAIVVLLGILLCQIIQHGKFMNFRFWSDAPAAHHPEKHSCPAAFMVFITTSSANFLHETQERERAEAICHCVAACHCHHDFPGSAVDFERKVEQYISTMSLTS